jgi:hypothetical protein
MNALTKKYNTHADLANERLAIAAQVTERILALKPTFHAICDQVRAEPEGFTLTTSAIVERAAGRIYAGHDKAARLLGCSVRKLRKLLDAALRDNDSFLAEAIAEKLAQVEAADRALFRARIG